MVNETEKQTFVERRKKPRVKTADDAFKYLTVLAETKNEEVDILEAAFALGVIFLPGIDVTKYRNQIRGIEKELKDCFENKLSSKSANDNVELRINAIREVVYKNNHFRGDKDDFENIDNINFIRLLETKTGIPVSIGVLLMHLTKFMKWQCEGMNFPGHFLLRMDFKGERVIIDPFEDAKVMEAHDLRELLKNIIGEKAELSHSFYEPVEKRDILLRLQNNLKARLIENGEYEKAILAVESIEAFYPEEYRLYLDKGVLFAKLKSVHKAIESLETYIKRSPDPAERQQANILLEQIKITML